MYGCIPFFGVMPYPTFRPTPHRFGFSRIVLVFVTTSCLGYTYMLSNNGL